MLAHSAFLASAAATLELQNEILPHQSQKLSDHCERYALYIWSKSCNIPSRQSIQLTGSRKYGMQQSHQLYTVIYWHVVDQRPTQRDFQQLRSAPHSGDCLQAPPITAIGLRLKDAWLVLLLASVLVPTLVIFTRLCVCGNMVDAQWLYEKFSEAPTTFAHEQCHMASHQTYYNSSGDGTSRFVNGWKTTWWSDSYPLVT